ncbi:MAG: efflux RND transporter periplasmic adaptor subunit [Acidobacteriota bacterium]|jgi:RND family efflux transporter MFP subunit|nr:efflux RND transporter periplasmic adaptor subunit [Bryobacteraceae bacterium CoA2 C42]MCA2963245.1 efflux RND transporter periplasmic adaptor subunit [Acidobacteriaceae bacterium]
MSFNRFALFAVILLALSGCGGKHTPETVKPEPATKTPVTLTPLTISEWPDGFEAVGTVAARTVTTVAGRVMGTVMEVRVRAGDRVAAGQTLVTVDARDLEAAQRQAQAGLDEAKGAIPEAESAIAAAQAQLDLARSTLRRMKELYEKRSLSAQEFDESNARVKVQEAAVAMARSRRRQIDDKIRQAEQAVEQSQIARGYAEIKAPFAGLVLARRVEPGALSAPGVPLVDVEQTGNYRLEAIVEESRLGAVKQGAMTTVTVDAIATPLTGRVVEIAPAVDPGSRAFVARIDLPANPALRGGLFGRARFSTGTRQVLAVPRAAVETQGQLQSVLVEEGGFARARLVSLGAAREETIEVLSGLRSGDRLILPRPAGLVDGAPVEVRP